MADSLEQVSGSIKNLSNCVIQAIEIDHILIALKEESIFFAEKIKLFFSNHQALVITTDDIPHFYGEGDLDFEFVEHNSSVFSTPPLINKKITNINLFNWKPNGITFFKPRTYLVQIEFYHHKDLILSAGFFYHDTSTNKMECLITGELSVNLNHCLSVNDYRKNLSVITLD